MRPLNTGSFGAALALATVLCGCDDASEAHGNDYAPSDEKGDIYGSDDRIERYELDDSEPLYELARSSAVLFRSESLSRTSQGRWKVSAPTLGQIQNLCEGERFAEQLAAGGCSATLIAPDVVLTAGHCISPIEHVQPSNPAVKAGCANTKIAFDYAYSTGGDDPSEFHEEDVFQCSEVLALEYAVGEEDWADYAVIKLDREVPGRTPVKLRDGDPVGLGTAVTLAGHPSGLPQKIAPGTVSTYINTRSECDGFILDVESFPGNSGSGVFDLTTNMVAGVVSQGNGGSHYVADPERPCNVARVCNVNGLCFLPGAAVVYDSAEMLSRLSDEVKSELEIVEVGGPSRCTPSNEDDTEEGGTHGGLVECIEACSSPADFPCFDACRCEHEGTYCNDTSGGGSPDDGTNGAHQTHHECLDFCFGIENIESSQSCIRDCDCVYFGENCG